MCFHCSERGYVKVKTPDLFDYLERRKHVHKAFPYLDAGQREQIMTGIHPACWDVMFPEPEDEDEQSE
jgi:hypothetical protein